MLQGFIKQVLNGRNAFISGSSFAGRTEIMNFLRGKLNPEHTVYLAPSRKDANRFHAENLHSFFAIDPEGTLLQTDSVFQHKIAKVRTIVIDEIQRVDATLFTAIDYRLRHSAKSAMKVLPFGGKQIIACGDFFEFQHERMPRSLHAFQCASWKAADFCNIIVDMSQDTILGQVLALLRHGDAKVAECAENGVKTQRNAIDILNRHIRLGYGRQQSREIILTKTKKEADRINAQQMKTLHTKKFVSSALCTYTEDYGREELPVDLDLPLQVGTRVIAMQSLNTQDGRSLYERGDLGRVIRIEFNQRGECTCQVRFDNGNVLPVCMDSRNPFFFWEYSIVPQGKGLQLEEASSYIQLPVMPAYALSLHATAGLRFAEISIPAEHETFVTGELYSILSRCQSLESLRMPRTIKKTDLLVDQAVVDFYSMLEKSANA